MNTTKLIACLLLAASASLFSGCLGAIGLAVAKSAAQGNAVKNATLGQQPGMVETAQKTGEAVRIMSANTSGQGEAIRYIDNPVDERHPQAVDPLGSDRTRVNNLQENLSYLEGLQKKPRYKNDPELAGRIANIKGQIKHVYINNNQKPPAFTDIHDTMRDAANNPHLNNHLMGAGGHIQSVTPMPPVTPTHSH